MTHPEFLQHWKRKYPQPETLLNGGEVFVFAARGSNYCRVRCPFCERKGKGPDKNHHCNAHYEQGWYKCVRCGSGGSIQYLLGIREEVKPAAPWKSYVSDPNTRKIDPAMAARSRGLEAARVKPGGCQPLNDLSRTHVAWKYLLSEGFSIRQLEQLCETHGIYYCISGIQITDDPVNTTTHRLIFEITEGGINYGWQARWLPKTWPPSAQDLEMGNRVQKYLFSPGIRKSFLLYNWDTAQEWDTWVLVEGIKKVWKTGPFGLAAFGASNTVKPPEETSEKVREQFWSMRLKKGNRPVVLIYDRDAWEICQEHTKGLIEMGIDATAIQLPNHKPGDLDKYLTPEILQLIKTHTGRLPQKIASK